MPQLYMPEVVIVWTPTNTGQTVCSTVVPPHPFPSLIEANEWVDKECQKIADAQNTMTMCEEYSAWAFIDQKFQDWRWPDEG